MRASVGKSTIRPMAPAKTPNKPVRTANLAWASRIPRMIAQLVVNQNLVNF